MKAFYYVCLFHEFERFLVKRIQRSIIPFDLFSENKFWFMKKEQKSEEIFQNKRTKNSRSNMNYNISVILISKCRIQKRFTLTKV